MSSRCWCAQDLPANYFWESLGFLPLAFRAGSTGKRRVHIYWQRRIDADQSEIGNPQGLPPIHRREPSAIPYWYPFQTSGGALRADRVAFPIPPGVHWKNVRPVEMPNSSVVRLRRAQSSRGQPAASSVESLSVVESKKRPIRDNGRQLDGARRGRAPDNGLVEPEVPAIRGLWFAPPKPLEPEKPNRRKKPKPEAAKFDPAFLAKARELRDRWMERVNMQPDLLLGREKYRIARLPQGQPPQGQMGERAVALLPAA